MALEEHPPARQDLDKAHEALILAYSHLNAAAAKTDPQLLKPVRDWTPATVEGLNGVHEDVDSRLRAVARLAAEIAHVNGRYQKHWGAYHESMLMLPRRHPVTSDPDLMANLLHRAPGMSGPEEMIEYLHSLGLSPHGPEFVNWTVIYADYGVFWDPVLPPAAAEPAPAEPVPAGAPPAPQAEHSRSVPQPEPPQAEQSRPMPQAESPHPAQAPQAEHSRSVPPPHPPQAEHSRSMPQAESPRHTVRQRSFEAAGGESTAEQADPRRYIPRRRLLDFQEPEGGDHE